MVPLFKSLIRPILEYANAVWCPSLRKDIDDIEGVQRYYTKCIIGMRNHDYNKRLMCLNLPSLEFRRFRGDLIEMFKICNGIYDPSTTNSLFQFTDPHNITRTNGLKVTKIRHNTKMFKFFFTNRINNAWNNLPQDVVNASSTNLFKNKIDNIFHQYKFCINLSLYYG